MTIRFAMETDIPQLAQWDRHISPRQLECAVNQQRILIAEVDDTFVGWLRWNLFWDNTPFMNLLFILEPYRGTGAGKALSLAWEQQMWDVGYETVMTSTQSNEYAQHFYEKLGYRAIGGFLLAGEPYEMIFAKTLE